jgi:hypothetical protein
MGCLLKLIAISSLIYCSDRTGGRSKDQIRSLVPRNSLKRVVPCQVVQLIAKTMKWFVPSGNGV